MFYFKSFESDTTQRCVRPANRYETDEFASERFVWSSSTGNVADPDKSGRSTRVPLTWNIFLRSTWTHFVDLIWKHSTGFFPRGKRRCKHCEMNQLFLELLIRPTLPPGIFQTKWRQWSWDFTVSLNEYAIRCEIAPKKMNGSTFWLNITKNEQSLINDRSSHWLTGRVQWTKKSKYFSQWKKRWSVSNWWLSYWLSIFGKRISKQEKQMWSTTL